jgi:hypothetical protein
MVIPFHLHNCGNSVDISELAFLGDCLRTPCRPINLPSFNELQTVYGDLRWQFICSTAY